MRLCCVLVAMVFLLRPDGAAMVAAAERAVPFVLAQAEKPVKNPGLFKFLFGGQRKERKAKPAKKSKAEPRKTTRKKATRKKSTRKKKRTVRRRTGKSKAKIIIAPRKTYDGPVSNVLVIGDFMAQAMAGGLVAAFKENPEIQIVNASEGASGLVRDDYFNWVRILPELVTKFKPAVIVIMVGANDRQPFRAGSGRIQTDTDAWRTAYAARVRELTNAVAIAKIPTYWAGLVPVSKASLSRDYSEFNTTYREAATSAGIPFVDLWGGFADDQGKFVARGPDINGQNRRLRINDGLNFTSAGKRKLAFFLEQGIKQIIRDGTVPQFAIATEGTPIDRQRISPMIALDTLSAPDGTQLSTYPVPEPEPEINIDPVATTMVDQAGPDTTALASAAVEPDKPAASEMKIEAKIAAPANVVIIRKPPPAGRIDNYTWPRPQIPLVGETPDAPKSAALDAKKGSAPTISAVNTPASTTGIQF